MAGWEGAICTGSVARRPLKVQQDKRDPPPQQWNREAILGLQHGDVHVLDVHTCPGPASHLLLEAQSLFCFSLTWSGLAGLTPISPEQKCLPPSLVTLTCTTNDAPSQRSGFSGPSLPDAVGSSDCRLPKAQARAHRAVLTDDTHTDTKKAPRGGSSQGVGAAGHSPSHPGRSARGRARRG